MTDTYSPVARARLMAKVRQKHTAPELLVRRALHALSFRFRLHRRDLPGHPDIVLPKHSIAVLVHGCFWHQHPGCRKSTLPATRHDWWAAKLAANVTRDTRNTADLRARGWKVIIIWECETFDERKLRARIKTLMKAAEIKQK